MNSIIHLLKVANRLRLGHQPIFLEYPVNLTPRWCDRGNSHIAAIIEAREEAFARNIAEMAEFEALVTEISEAATIDWSNHFIPALDGLSLMWAAGKAKNTIMEIGSGNSTIFIRSALRHSGSPAKLISIDPHPRAEIDALCDEVIRKPLEDVDLELFDRLGSGDVLFIDNSHRSFMNSDVTVVMLDILPRLPTGTLVGFHDIFLPYDYFEAWAQRAYNEQYLLACHLLGGSGGSAIELANYWIYRRRLHEAPLKGIWSRLGAKARDRPPSAFWLTKRH